MKDNINYEAPEDWGVSSEDAWVSFEELRDNGAPILEGRDVVGFADFSTIPLSDATKADIAQKKKQGVKIPDGTRGQAKDGRAVIKQGKNWVVDKKLDDLVSSIQNEGKEEQKQTQKEPETARVKTESKEEPTYNVEVKNKAKRGANNVVIDEEDIKQNFSSEEEQKIVKSLINIVNSQLVQTSNGSLFEATAGKGGKKDRTLLWEEAEALSNRSDKAWNNLISSEGPYNQEKVNDFRESVFIKDNVSPEMAEYVYARLPAAAKTQLKKNGTPAKNFTGIGNTPEEQSQGKKATDARGVAILHTYFKQGGKDAYTGLPIKLGDTEAEHINVQSQGGLDHPMNLVLIRGGVNQLRGADPIQNLVRNAKAAYGDGSDEQKEKLEKTRESRAKSSEQRGDAKGTINSIPMDELLGMEWEDMRREFDSMTGGNKGTQYALRRINFYNLGNRLRGGKVVTPSTVSFPMGRAYWQGNEQERQELRDSYEGIRENFRNWLNDGKGTPKEYILSVHSALQKAGASDEEQRKAFLDKFFINVADTHNDWLVSAHGYPPTTAEELKSYYETL